MMIYEQKTFLLDMDGTIYLGDELIEGAHYFFDILKKYHKNWYFLTNNSSKDRKDYVDKLQRLGIEATEDDIFTSADATLLYLRKQYPHAKNLFVIGTPALEHLFKEAGYQVFSNKRRAIDLVVLGFDTTLTYEKLWFGCDLIREQIPYIATHPDFNCPIEKGKFMPDIGAMIAFIKASTGMEPEIVGKPNKIMIDSLCSLKDLNKKDLVMVGDRLYTDIKTGIHANIKTALVLSGETDRTLYNQSDIVADYVYDSIYEIAKEIEANL
ncbi:MAG: HAD-IIA family hydrolase [Tissierellia bacterium]|nr:HAD-IIA family hydrolase [Tissierellia bacterium]